LFSTDDLVKFEAALVGDDQGQTPFFDSADRAAFFDSSRPQYSDDLDTGDTDRYTFRAAVDDLKATTSLSLRLTPSDAIAGSKAALKKLDSHGMSVQPGATHRWLFEVPSDAGTMRNQVDLGPCSILCGPRPGFDLQQDPQRDGFWLMTQTGGGAPGSPMFPWPLGGSMCPSLDAHGCEWLRMCGSGAGLVDCQTTDKQ